MYFCYVDESGTPDLPGNTSHYVLVGLAIPYYKWQFCDDKILEIKKRYLLQKDEIHTAYIYDTHRHEKQIPDFEKLSYEERRKKVLDWRSVRLAEIKGKKHALKLREYKRTEPYIHLTYAERMRFISDIIHAVSKWDFMKVFGECIDKVHFAKTTPHKQVADQALENVINRYERFLARQERKCHGIVIHDACEGKAARHTELMRKFHERGTFWTSVRHIVETPFFVDSKLTVMVQIADLCGYLIRRYLENDEKELFQLIHPLADDYEGRLVGLRHYTNVDKPCACLICQFHK